MPRRRTRRLAFCKISCSPYVDNNCPSSLLIEKIRLTVAEFSNNRHVAADYLLFVKLSLNARPVNYSRFAVFK